MPKVYHIKQLPLFPTKTCIACHVEKPLEEFYKDRSMSDGYKPTCKACYYARQRELHPERAIHRSTYSQPFISTTHKTCSDCHQEKTLEEFHRDKSTSSGRKSYCKECVKIRHDNEKWRVYHRAYHHANKTRLNAEARKRYRANRDHKLAYTKAYYRKTKARKKFLQQQRMADPVRRAKMQMYHIAFREAHPEIVSARNRRWRKANPLTARNGYMRYRARKVRAAIGSVDYVRVLARDGYNCHICGGVVAPDDIHFDHVIPLARHGAHSEDNIKVAHSVCNLRKGAFLMEELTPFQRRGPSS